MNTRQRHRSLLLMLSLYVRLTVNMVSATMLNINLYSVTGGAEADMTAESGRGLASEVQDNTRMKRATPETAAGALGTAHGVRVRKAEAWAEGMRKKKEAGGSRGRKRGKGAQLRRKMRKQEAGFERWRQQHQQHGPVDPGAARAKAQGMGHTRDLSRQLGESRCRQRRAEQQMHAAEAGAVEAERLTGIMTRLLERRGIRKVEQLQKEKHDAVSRRQGRVQRGGWRHC